MISGTYFLDKICPGLLYWFHSWHHHIMVNQKAMNRGTNTVPPVLPQKLIDFTMAQFGDLTVTQRICLLTSYTQNEIAGLENCFKDFKQQLSSKHEFREMVQQMDDCILFDDAWSTFFSRYPLLCNF